MTRATLLSLANRRQAVAVAVAIVYVTLYAATALLSRLDGGVSLVSIANGFMVPWLSFQPARRWTAPLVWSFALGAAAATLLGFTWRALPFTAISLAECAITIALLRRWIRGPRPLDSIENVVKFIVISGLAVPALGAVCAGVASALLVGVQGPRAALDWFTAHGLGLIVVAPIVTLLLEQWRGKRDRSSLPPYKWREAVLWLAPTAIVATFTFAQTTMPLLFLPLVAMMIATLRLGRLGAAGSSAILALIGGVLTAFDRGPVNLIDGSVPLRLQFLQFYFACAAGMMLPLAALLRQRRTLIRDLEASEAGYRLMTEYSGDILLHCSLDGTIRRALGDVGALGYRPESHLGRPVLSLIHPDDWHAITGMFPHLLAQPNLTQTMEYRVLTPGGGARWCEARARAILGEDGQIVGTISAVRDIEERKAAERELARAAATDSLTGLLNRGAFMATLDKLELSDKGHVLAVVDLDHFKRINDRFGHAVGDEALRMFAQVVRRWLRGTDLVGRVGGEEFAILMRDVELDEALVLCERLRRVLGDTSFDAGNGGRQRMTASFGLASIERLEDIHDALRRADEGLYAAKAAGRDCLRMAA